MGRIEMGASFFAVRYISRSKSVGGDFLFKLSRIRNILLMG